MKETEHVWQSAVMRSASPRVPALTVAFIQQSGNLSSEPMELVGAAWQLSEPQMLGFGGEGELKPWGK